MIEAWRLCRRVHANLAGEGPRLWGGRWNSPGRPLVYLAEHPALTILEVRVHLDLPLELLPEDYVLMRVRLPDAVSGMVGDTWLREGGAAMLRVPSVLVPQAWNLLLNPVHPLAAQASVTELIPFRFDPRLWADQTNPRQGSGRNA